MRIKLQFLIVLLLLAYGCKTKEVVNTNHIIDSNTIQGFLGIKWGESIDSVKQKLLQRNPTAQISSESPYELSFMNTVVSADCPFEVTDNKISSLKLSFSSLGFCSAFATFEFQTDDQSSTFYHKLNETIKEKYGEPTFFSTALEPVSNWRSNDSCFITILKFKDNQIALGYTNSLLNKKYEAEKAEYEKRINNEKVELEKQKQQQEKEKVSKDF